MTSRLATGAMFLCLILCAGCSAKSAKSASDLPELAALAVPVAAPAMENIETNGDLIDALLDYEEALQVCNGKLGAIRKAYAGRGGGHGKVEGYD